MKTNQSLLTGKFYSLILLVKHEQVIYFNKINIYIRNWLHT